MIVAINPSTGAAFKAFLGRNVESMLVPGTMGKLLTTLSFQRRQE